jgi:hypothetical protein
MLQIIDIDADIKTRANFQCRYIMRGIIGILPEQLTI